MPRTLALRAARLRRGCAGDWTRVGWVAYPLAAANISRPLVSRLKSLHQPVVRARIRFSALRSRLLACVSTGLSPVV
jgi:hypothetical protein